MDAVIDFLERWFGVRITRVLRWLLFLPVSIVYGVVFLVIVGAAATSASKYFGGGDDLLLGALVMGIISVICAGYGTIQIAIAIAPGLRRAVVVITWFACLVVAVALVWWARRTSDTSFLISAWATAILYALSSSVAAIVFVFGGERQDGFN